MLLEHTPELCGLAENPALPDRLLEQFISVANEELLSDLSNRDGLSVEHRRLLLSRDSSLLNKLVATDDPWAILAALHRDDAPASWGIVDLARHPDHKVRAQVPHCVDDRLDILELLADDPQADVVESVAGSLSLTPAIARRIYPRPDCAIRDALAENNNTPADLLAELVLTGGTPALSLCGTCRDLPNEDARRERCGDHAGGLARVRSSALGNPSTPQELIGQFLAEAEFWARNQVAGRPDLTPELSEMLAADKDPSVRRWLAENPVIPPTSPS